MANLITYRYQAINKTIQYEISISNIGKELHIDLS
jgi:hypothetical protein